MPCQAAGGLGKQMLTQPFGQPSGSQHIAPQCSRISWSSLIGVFWFFQSYRTSATGNGCPGLRNGADAGFFYVILGYINLPLLIQSTKLLMVFRNRRSPHDMYETLLRNGMLKYIYHLYCLARISDPSIIGIIYPINTHYIRCIWG